MDGACTFNERKAELLNTIGEQQRTIAEDLKRQETLLRSEQGEFEASAKVAAVRRRNLQKNIEDQIELIGMGFENNCEKIMTAHRKACDTVKAKIAEENVIRKKLSKENDNNWQHTLDRRSSEFVENGTTVFRHWIDSLAKLHSDLDVKIIFNFRRLIASRDQMRDPKMRTEEDREIKLDRDRLIRITGRTSEAFDGHCQRILSSRSMWNSCDTGFESAPSSARNTRQTNRREIPNNSSWRRQLSARGPLS
jgi:hypothetical protein